MLERQPLGTVPSRERENGQTLGFALVKGLIRGLT